MDMMIERQRLYKYLTSAVYHASGSIILTARDMSYVFHLEGLGVWFIDGPVQPSLNDM
jgi:hypothetical protein